MIKAKMYLKKLLICGMVFVIVIALLLILERHRVSTRTPIFSIVSENLEAYNKVARLTHQILEDCGKCRGHIHLYRPIDGKSIVWHSDFGHEEREFQYELSKDEKHAFETVFDTYRMRKTSYTLQGIRVTENFVVFYNNMGGSSEGSGLESLIYSVSGERPNFVNSPFANESYTSTTIQRITENWFYARVNFG